MLYNMPVTTERQKLWGGILSPWYFYWGTISPHRDRRHWLEYAIEIHINIDIDLMSEYLMLSFPALSGFFLCHVMSPRDQSRHSVQQVHVWWAELVWVWLADRWAGLVDRKWSEWRRKPVAGGGGEVLGKTGKRGKPRRARTPTTADVCATSLDDSETTPPGTQTHTRTHTLAY